jgi:hypothetical protein
MLVNSMQSSGVTGRRQSSEQSAGVDPRVAGLEVAEKAAMVIQAGSWLENDGINKLGLRRCGVRHFFVLSFF